MRRFVAVVVGIVGFAVAPAFAAPGDSTAPDLGAARAYVTDDAGILTAREQGRLER